MRGGAILTISNDNILNLSGIINTTYKLDENIIKIHEADEHLYIFQDDDKLYNFHITRPEVRQEFDVSRNYLTMLLDWVEIEVYVHFTGNILRLEIKDDPRYIFLILLTMIKYT